MSEFQFSNNLPNTLTGSTSGAGNWFSDNFLGTDSIGQNQKLQLMNEANRFTDYQSRTQYQRSVEDMLKAGINPMVAFASGANPNSAMGSNTQQGSSGKSGILGKELANITHQFLGAFNGQAKEDAINVLKAIGGVK